MKHDKILIILSNSSKERRRLKVLQHYFDFRGLKVILLKRTWYKTLNKTDFQSQIDQITKDNPRETHKVSVLILRSCCKLYDTLNFNKIHSIILENPISRIVYFTKEQLCRVFILTHVKLNKKQKNVVYYDMVNTYKLKSFNELYEKYSISLYKFITGII